MEVLQSHLLVMQLLHLSCILLTWKGKENEITCPKTVSLTNKSYQLVQGKWLNEEGTLGSLAQLPQAALSAKNVINQRRQKQLQRHYICIWSVCTMYRICLQDPLCIILLWIWGFFEATTKRLDQRAASLILVWNIRSRKWSEIYIIVMKYFQ